MAVNRTKKQETPLTALIKTREVFKNQIQDRIERGKTLLNMEIKTAQELDAYSTDYDQWDDYNSELIKSSFNIPNNEYKRKYEECTTGLGWKSFFEGKGRQVISREEERLNDIKERIEIKLSELQKLSNIVDLIPNLVENGNFKFHPASPLLSMSIEFREERTKLLGSINSLVIEGHLEEALDNLEKAASGQTSFAKETTLLKAQLREIEKKDRIGTASPTEIETRRNKLRASILDLKDQMIKS